MKKKKAEVWMKQVFSAFLCAAITIGGGTGTVIIAEDGNGEPATTETTQSAEKTPTGEGTQPLDTETPKTGNEQAPAEGETKDDGKKGNAPVTGNTDAKEDGGNSSTSESQEPAPAKENPLDLDKSTPASEAVAEAAEAPTAETEKRQPDFQPICKPEIRK